jgi:polyhydroxybutyrate depolymerase
VTASLQNHQVFGPNLRLLRRWVIAFSVVLTACPKNSAPATVESETGQHQALDASQHPKRSQVVKSHLLAARPYRKVVPAVCHDRACPLLILLHGYGNTGEGIDSYFQMSAATQKVGVLLATPEGTRDAEGNRFWNATDACCNRFLSQVDDVSYLTAVMEDMMLKHQVDETRVFFAGHSNGGFMAHRMGCERSPQVAAIFSLAGAQWAMLDRCTPTHPVSVAQAHGTADAVIRFQGGSIFDAPIYPGAVETFERWTSLNGCDRQRRRTGVFDFDSAVPGPETSRETSQRCPRHVAVELWTLKGSGHSPSLDLAWASAVLQFLLEHPKSK